MLVDKAVLLNSARVAVATLYIIHVAHSKNLQIVDSTRKRKKTVLKFSYGKYGLNCGLVHFKVSNCCLQP